MSWTAGLVGGAAVAVAAVSGGAVLLAANDGDRSLAPVVVPVVSSVPTMVPTSVETAVTTSTEAPTTVAPDMPPVAALSPPVTVAMGLAERVGVLTLRGDEFMLDGVELDVGPDWWAASTSAGADLDGDGVIGTWFQEMNGLVGRSIKVLADVEDDDIDAFEVNGVLVRSLDSLTPPWSDGDDDRDERSRDVVLPAGGLTGDAASAIALAQIPGIVTDARLDADDGRIIWDLEVRATDGVEYDVEIDAVTGVVLEMYRD